MPLLLRLSIRRQLLLQGCHQRWVAERACKGASELLQQHSLQVVAPRLKRELWAAQPALEAVGGALVLPILGLRARQDRAEQDHAEQDRWKAQEPRPQQTAGNDYMAEPISRRCTSRMHCPTTSLNNALHQMRHHNFYATAVAERVIPWFAAEHKSQTALLGCPPAVPALSSTSARRCATQTWLSSRACPAALLASKYAA